MMSGFINRVTSAGQLKDALDVQSQRVGGIADRVSRASLQNQDGFAIPAPRTGPGAQLASSDGVDIETEMTNLADEQLRYSATATVLPKAYQQVRDSLKS